MDTAKIRRARQEDLPALVRLAELDEKPYPLGPVLVAEREGEIVAALPLSSGPAIADPFRHTLELVALLELRAKQVEPSRAAGSWRERLAAHAPATLRRTS